MMEGILENMAQLRTCCSGVAEGLELVGKVGDADDWECTLDCRTYLFALVYLVLFGR